MQAEQEIGQFAKRYRFRGRRQRTFGNDDLDRHFEVSINGFPMAGPPLSAGATINR
jgi:hypothetical protein